MIRAIAISRQSGSGGRSVSESLAREMDFSWWDRDLIAAAARKYGIEEPRLHALYDKPLDFAGRSDAMEEARTYLHYIHAVICNLLHEGHRMVILGRGAHMLLKDFANTFCVRLIAPLDIRIERVAAQKKVTRSEARTYVESQDETRRLYHQHLYGVDWDDPRYYDLVLNTGRLSTDATTQILQAAARGSTSPRWVL